MEQFDSTIQLIKDTLEKIRPFLQRDGGDCTYDSFEDGIVYINFVGACLDCSLIGETLYDGIEAILMEEVPGVIGVRLTRDKPQVKAAIKKLQEENKPE